MSRPEDAHKPPAAGLFGLQPGAACATRSAVPAETATAFARLFASSEVGARPTALGGMPGGFPA